LFYKSINKSIMAKMTTFASLTNQEDGIYNEV